MLELERWIQKQHLGDERLLQYRQAFQAHPARAIILKTFLVDEVAAALSNFLSSEAQYERRYGLYSSHEKAVTETAWLAAKEDDRFYKYERLTSPRGPSMLTENLVTFLQFRSAWSDEPFAEFFRQATGLPLAASSLDNAHAFKPGDFLLSHRDDHDQRRLAVVLYLSQDWKPEHGGALELSDRDGNVTRVEPEFNSLLLFDVHAESLHQILPVIGNRTRYTMGGWLDG